MPASVLTPVRYARSSQAFNHPCRKGVRQNRYDRCWAGPGTESAGQRITRYANNIWGEPHNLPGQIGIAAGMAFGRVAIDYQITTLEMAEAAQLLEKGTPKA